MAKECPHCGGKLIEKHHETITEGNRTFKQIHYRCLNCKKWTTEEVASSE